MRAFSGIQFSAKLLQPLPRPTSSSSSFSSSSISRTWTCFPRQLIPFRVHCAEPGANGVQFSVVSVAVLTAEKEEAKAILTLFLRKQGLSNTVAVRIVNKSDQFIDHLVSKLHSVHKTSYLVGRELTTLEIRDALVPYLESLQEEHGDLLVDMVDNFPNPPGKERPTSAFPIVSALESQKQKAMDRVTELDHEGKFPPHILYLIKLGMGFNQIKAMTRKFPSFAYYSLEGKIKPVVEFLLELGIPQSDIPTILHKRPQLCGISLSENLKPTMAYLEDLGLDKTQWAKVILRFPAILTYSRQKLKSTVDYFNELGLTEESIGKIITRCPSILSYSVDDKLRATAEYFRSMGVDVAVLLQKSPQTFGLSIEASLKPVTEFFLERGYSIEEVGTMISRYGALYTFSLSGNMIPKWEYFLTMDYPRSDLVKFPQYFGYSLEERIKPRYAQVKASGVNLILNLVLSTSDIEFQRVLKKRIKKMADKKASSNVNCNGDVGIDLKEVRP